MVGGIKMADTDSGYLIIQTTTAGMGLPVEGAHITVSRMGDGERVERVLTTDRNGRTEKIILPAPSRENSLTPEGTDDYSIYKVQTDKEGYYPIENLAVPVFGGQTTVQQVALIPLPLGSTATPTVIEDKEPENL